MEEAKLCNRRPGVLSVSWFRGSGFRVQALRLSIGFGAAI